MDIDKSFRPKGRPFNQFLFLVISHLYVMLVCLHTQKKVTALQFKKQLLLLIILFLSILLY
jgi:hypothetical protein